jgi:hypothetical protein
LSPTPLEETQTGVEWTHCLVGRVRDIYALLVEKHNRGIYPHTIENYLNWMIGKAAKAPFAVDPNDVDVSVEAEPGEAFIARLDALERITAATFRVVRPNPGWGDLEDDLGDQAGESKAQRADVTMHSRRRGTLRAPNKMTHGVHSGLSKSWLDKEVHPWPNRCWTTNYGA